MQSKYDKSAHPSGAARLILSTLWLLSNNKDCIVAGFIPNTNRNNRQTHVAAGYSIVSISRPSYSSCSKVGVAASEGEIASKSTTTTTNSKNPSPPDMIAYAKGYTTVFTELPFANNPPTTGTLPPDLLGSYYRSGPAMFSAGSLPPPKTSIVKPKTPPIPDGQDPDRMVKHPFDADGAVLGITFSGDGTLTARFRYVRTTAFTNERKKGMRLYNGMGSTRVDGSTLGNGQGNDFPTPLYRHHLRPGLNKRRKNTSNTRAIYWSKKLLSLWEGGLPYKLDSLALSTEGRSQLGGILQEAQPFSGTAKYDPANARMVFYANQQDSSGSVLTLYEFNDKFRLVNKIEHRLKTGFALLSDFGVTESFALFVQPEVAVNGMSMMVNKDPGTSLKVEAGSIAYLHLMSRDLDKTLTTIPIPHDGISDADLQFCNAYEEDDDTGSKTIVFDVIRSDGTNTAKGGMKEWPWVSSLKDFQESSSQKSLWRYRYRSGKVEKECIDSTFQTSFGVINPEFSGKKHQFIYATVGAMGSEVAPPQGIAKFDVEGKTTEVWFPKEYEFCGEPVYAPRAVRTEVENDTDNEKDNDNDKDDDEPSPPSYTTVLDTTEDGGYIISVLLNGKTQESHIIVFDAQSITSGPIAQIPLGMGIPHGLHGCFTAAEEATWPADEIERRTRLADKMESRGNRWNEVKSDFSGLGLRLDDFEEYFGDIL